MKNILGIDYGRKKIGVALATGPISEPLGVYKAEDIYKKLEWLIKEHEVNRFVVGLSEGEMAEEAKIFGEKLSKQFALPVEFVDETLTTEDVLQQSIEAGMSRKKRKSKEDAFAAALILQTYLDSL